MALASCLIDTNILLRATGRSDPHHPIVASALARLILQETTLHYTLQNIAELWNVMTRPVARNGFGLTVSEAEREVRAIEAGMILLPDTEAVYRQWRQIIVHYGISGVRVPDARLAASMYAHGVRHILTLNVADFGRFTDLTAVHPNDI